MRQWVWLVAVGCVEPRAGRVFSAEVGPEGGTLAGGGVTLTIPAGALEQPETLKVHVDDVPAPDGGAARSPVYRFEPAGLELLELALVEVDVDGDDVGTLLWTTLDDPDVFEEIGLASGGHAEGNTWHFSEMYVGDGVCTLPEPTTVCACRAGDEVEDLLCPEDPTSGEVACDVDGFHGADGGPCAGYGPRAELESWCDCHNDQVGYLCPDPYQFDPQQQCPSENGLNGFHGEVGQACSGHHVDGASYSGTMLNCSIQTVDTTYELVSGALEGCYDTSASEKKIPPSQRCSTTNQSWTQACTGKLPSKSPYVACPAFGDPAVAGTKIGQALEQKFEGQAPAGARHVKQVSVPEGSKNGPYCKGKTTGQAGFLDIVRVMDSGAGPVTLQLAEIKPMTGSGLDLGWKEVMECYVDAVDAAATKCAQGQARTVAEDRFCTQIGATDRDVSLANPPTLTWEPGAKIPVTIGGVTQDVEVLSCAPGVTAYTCR